jgi:hypothetical protein
MVTLEDIIDIVLEFQNKRNIKKQCISNVQFLYDSYHESYNQNNNQNNKNSWGICKAKAKAVIVVGIKAETSELVINPGHLVLSLNKTKFRECSYEINNYKKAHYFDNWKLFLKFITEQDLTHKFKQNCLTEFISFQKFAETINNGNHCIPDLKYYHELADYVDEQIEKIELEKTYLK